jgi:hypothetical protein
MILSPSQDAVAKASFKDRSVPRSSKKRDGRPTEHFTVAKPGEYSDLLRAIGQFFDDCGACSVEVVHQGSFLSAAWEDGSQKRQERHFRALELDDLREQARAQRANFDLTPRLTTSEILRALGDECDRREIEVASLSEMPDGFHLSGLVEGNLYNHIYTPGEVTRLVVEQRARRRSPVSG